MAIEPKLPISRVNLLNQASCVLLLSLIFIPAMRGQEASSLEGRMHTAAFDSSLDIADVKAWHLKMTVQLFDAKGNPSDNGTIEEWFSSPEVDRREYKTSAYSATEIRRDGKVYRTRGADLPPYFLGLLRRQVVRPVFWDHPPYILPQKSAKDSPKAASWVPIMRKVKIGKISLDCISDQSTSAKENAGLATNYDYCLNDGGDSLRMTLALDSQQIYRNAIGKFQGKEVATDAVVYVNAIKAASEHVDKLATEDIPASEFEVSPETPVVDPSIVTEGDDVKTETFGAGSILSRPDPIYPEIAKAKHIAGTVVMRAIVSANGGIRNLQLISSSDPVLVSASMDAVRQWKYKPATLNGQPIELETTIKVRFTFGQ